jgi:hypothetical protein
MNLIVPTLAFIGGFVAGVGVCVLYFNHKVKTQIGMMEEHIEDIDEMMGAGLGEGLEPGDEDEEE